MSADEGDFLVPADNIEIDLEAVRAKYKHERDKRLRSDGNNQYRDAGGELTRYLDDPDADPNFTRPPLNDEVGILIVGGGWAGLLAAVRLGEAGFDDFRILDNGGDFGGTWYWNRYPGAQCDVESYIYMPLLEETGYMPTEKYARANEIREYAGIIGKKFDLYKKAYFHTQVTEMVWSEEEKLWTVSTTRGDRIKARWVISSCGSLNRAKLPGIPGLETFKGHAFHTARWDYNYTGGDSTGNLHKLADKRVALVGTGATAVQCMPHLARSAKQLFVFQRTPSHVDERGNRPTDPEWVKTLTPGWQKRRMENFYAMLSGVPQEADLVNDGWTKIVGVLGGAFMRTHSPEGDIYGENVEEDRQRQNEIADYLKMEYLRKRVETIIEDEEKVELLKPWYRYFCKRPCFSDDYLPAFNRPNVTLVDTAGRGAERITETGIVFDGVEYEVDCIVFATGFEVGTDYSHRSGFTVRGRGGKTLSDHWADGYRTLHGMWSHGFPNLLFMGPTQGAGSFNVPHSQYVQADYIQEVLRGARDRGAQCLEPTAEAEAAYLRLFNEQALKNLDFHRQCTPGYYNNEGQPGPGKGFTSQRYGGGLIEYCELVRQWQDDGMPGLAGIEGKPAGG